MSRTLILLMILTQPAMAAPEPCLAQQNTAAKLLDLQTRLESVTGPERRELLRQQTRLDPAQGDGWKQLSESLFATGDRAEAIEAWRRAMALGSIEVADGECQLARFVAGDSELATQFLLRCLSAGYRFAATLPRDSDLAPLLEVRAVRELLTLPDETECDGARGWELDLRFLLSEIHRVHWTHRRQELPRETRARVDRLRREIPELTDPQAAVALQWVLASLGDGHSVLYPLGMRRGRSARLPAGLWIFEDGLYVVSAAPGYEELLGHRVLAIGGVAVATLIERIKPWVSHDNDSGFRWVVPLYLTFAEYLKVAGADFTKASNSPIEWVDSRATRSSF